MAIMKSLIVEFVQESVADDNEARKVEHQNAQQEVGRKAVCALTFITFPLKRERPGPVREGGRTTVGP